MIWRSGSTSALKQFNADLWEKLDELNEQNLKKPRL